MLSSHTLLFLWCIIIVIIGFFGPFLPPRLLPMLFTFMLSSHTLLFLWCIIIVIIGFFPTCPNSFQPVTLAKLLLISNLFPNPVSSPPFLFQSGFFCCFINFHHINIFFGLEKKFG